jgi:hypothetical protein
MIIIPLVWCPEDDISVNIEKWGESGYLWRSDIPYVYEDIIYHLSSGVKTYNSIIENVFTYQARTLSSYSIFARCVDMYMRIQ